MKRERKILKKSNKTPLTNEEEWKRIKGKQRKMKENEKEKRKTRENEKREENTTENDRKQR